MTRPPSSAIRSDRMRLLNELADALIPYTPEELIAIAQTEYDWCMREMLKASHEMGFGDNWHAAVEKVKQMHVPPGEQPDLIRKLVVEGSDFVKKNDLVTVPPLADETWRMIMMTPERQLVNPFFTGGNEISVSYPTDTMTYRAARDEHARQQHSFCTRHRFSRNDSRAFSAVLHGRPLSSLPPCFWDAVLA